MVSNGVQKAALYVRVSTHHQVDKDSLPYQKKELINYSKYLLGIDNYEVFTDAGYSGKDTDRPAYQDMMKRIRLGEFTHVLVWKLDRISRNLMDFTKMYEELKDYNITFISKNEQFDTSTAMGEAMLKIILIFAELERKLTAERVYGIMLSRAEKGLWNGAPVPLGYYWPEEGDFPEVDSEEAETVKFIYNSYEEQKSCGEVKHLLETNNIRTKNDKTWTSKTIADIIRNPFYKGTYRYNYREAARGAIKNEDEWIIVPDNHQAIISTDQWGKCNAIMDSNLYARGPRSLNFRTHIFAGLIECGKCEKNYAAATDRPRSGGYRPSVYRCFNYVHSKKDYRTCNGGIGEVKLGPFVINYISNVVKASDYVAIYGHKTSEKEIEDILLSGSMFENIVGIYPEDLSHTYRVLLKNTGDILFDKIEGSNNAETDKELSKIRAEKSKLERALTRLEDLYLFSDDTMSEKSYLIRKQDIEKKISGLNDKIKSRSKELAKSVPGHDLNFIKKATQYLLAHNLMGNKEIGYNSLVQKVDKDLLKDFMNCVINKVVIEENKNVSAIEFVNGMTHRFVHKD